KVQFGLRPISTGDVYEIVGVLPPETNFRPRVALFTPAEITHENSDRGGSHNWRTIGRLKRGVSIEKAQADINTLTQRQSELYPDTNKGWTVQIESLRDYLFGNSSAALLLLFGAVAIVLVIACANVANLQLGRVHTRRRELAVRLALGAGLFRIMRQFLIENMLLAALGGALGVFVAAACLSLVRTFGPNSIPRLTESSLSIPAFCFALAVSCLSTILFGLVPAFQASQLQPVDAGIKGDRLLTAGLSLSFGDYPNGSPQRAQVFRNALETLGALPGVTSVGAISHLPLGGRTMKQPFWIAGEDNGKKSEERVTDYRVVTTSFFQ